jgi:uncharacterized membrane protein YccF (DUF307 family)
MSPIAFLLNLLWILFGGLWMALGWIVAAVIMAITIIGLPWARAAFNIASYEGRFHEPNIPADTISAPGRSGSSAISSGWCLPAGGWR